LSAFVLKSLKKSIEQKIILLLATLVSRPVLLIFRTSLKIKIHNGKFINGLRKDNRNFIMSFWHENMILPLLVHDGQGIHALVSRHFDGEVIARILGAFGLPSIRGSSTRGGRKAFLEMKKKMLHGKFEAAFTPDGPTGPRRRIKLGVIRLAAETGAPILPVGVAASRFKRMNSWDRLLLILPFSKCVLIYGQPFYVPAECNGSRLKDYAEKLAAITNRLDKEAAGWL
jgi:lysophospholipid acyltransferase (LPLAT)-like uncharacterized protein